tara:strand:- start:903 stop:5105 length:4203 start_codon:yes stop_codon:yes gene_type:complete
MALMRASLRDFVATQLNIRQEILKLGGKGKENARNSSVTLKIKDGDEGAIKNVTLQRGSFFTQAISRQSTIRMYSGADIKPGTFKEYPNEPTGVKLAKQFFLEGGTGYNPDGGMDAKSGFSRNSNSSENFKKNNNATGAYGSVKSRSNPHKGYGIVPMPGITDATIRTVSDYGSLRVAKVNFICYNLPQLEVLELLYMRPGFPVLIEWGWAPYINNEGKIIEDIPYFDDFWKSTSNLWDMQKKVIKRKETFSGNYDAVIGFIKNFSFKARADGGFDCTTEVMGYGEIMEGIVGNNDTTSVRKTETDNDLKEILSEDRKKEYGAPPIPDWVLSLENKAGLEDNFVWLLSSLAYYSPLSSGIENLSDGNYRVMIETDEYQQGVGLIDQADEKNPITANSFQKGLSKVISYFQAIDPTSPTYSSTAGDIFDNYVVGAGFKGITTEGDHSTSYEKIAMAKDIEDQIFIRWDFMCELINKFCLPQAKDTIDTSALTKYSYTHPNSDEYISYVGPPFLDIEIKNSIYKTLSTRYFSPYKNQTSYKIGNTQASTDFHGLCDSNEYIVQSLDPNICIMPNQRTYEHGLRTAGKELDGSGVSEDKLAYDNDRITVKYQDAAGEEQLMTRATTRYASTKTMKGPRGYYVTGGDDNAKSNRYIGLIYLNYSFLMKKYKSMKNKKNFSLFNFLQEVWKEVSEKACAGNHEFIFHTEEDNATIRVVDLNIDPTKKPPSNVFEFKVQDNESIVREFNFASAIPNSISATIAIAAQSPECFNGDSTTLATFNKHVESRFSEPIRQQSKEEGNLSRLQSYRDLIENFTNNCVIIQEYFNNKGHNYSQFGINLGRMDISTKEISEMRKLIKQQVVFIHQLNSIAPTYVNINPNLELDEDNWYQNPQFEEYFPEISYAAIEAQNTSIIPLSLTMAIDGISGIRIGDVIKIHNNPLYPRLPRGYIRDDIHWVIFGDDHSVTSGQDWIQKLTCTLSLMGSKSHKPIAAITSTSNSVSRRLIEEEEKERDALDRLIVSSPQVPNHPSDFLNPVAHLGINIKNPSYNFGPRSLNDGFHNGVDIQPGKDKNGKVNNDIYAPHKMEVIKIFNAADGNACGNGIKVNFIKPNNYSVGNDTANYGLFCHLDSFNEKKDGEIISVGDKVLKGEKIGTMGNTGKSSGKHLHYGLSMDPSFAGGDPKDPDATGRYVTKRFLKYSDGSTSSENVVTTYEREFGVDPGYFISAEDNLTAFFEYVVKDLGASMEETLIAIGTAYARRGTIPSYSYPGVSSACVSPGREYVDGTWGDKAGETKNWPGITDGGNCEYAFVRDMNKAFENMIPENTTTGRLPWDGAMTVTPIYGNENQATFYSRMYKDDVSAKIHACATRGEYNAEACTPESVGIGGLLQETNKSELLTKGIMKE